MINNELRQMLDDIHKTLCLNINSDRDDVGDIIQLSRERYHEVLDQQGDVGPLYALQTKGTLFGRVVNVVHSLSPHHPQKPWQIVRLV